MVRVLARAALAAGIFLGASVAQAAPTIGKQAPDFKLPADDGKTYELSQLKGKYVVLEWFNNDCPYVEKHYHADHRNMQNLQQKWIEQANKEGKELVWFGVVTSPPGKQGYVNAADAKKLRTE